jgi:hypothetical protein
MSKASSRFTILPSLLLGLLFLCSCKSTPEEPEGFWAKAELQAASEKILDETTQLALHKQGYPGRRGLESDLSIETLWQNHLAPFRGQGYRLQALVKYTPLGAGRYECAVRVKKQKNQALVRPLDLSYAEWEWVEDDEDSARILLQLIRSYFGPEVIEKSGM